jgi:hypothetical protein
MLTVMLFATSVSSAQTTVDTLSMLKSGGKYVYFQGQREVRFFDLIKITEPNQEALKYMKYAKTNNTFANVFLGLGLISFGYGCLAYLDSGDQDKIMTGITRGAIVGGTMVLISIPLRIGKHKNTRKAIAAYNAGI